MKKTTPSLILILALTVSLLTSTIASAAPITFTVATAPYLGTITGSGINCGSDCSESIEEGTAITLTATPQPGLLLDHGTGCPSDTPGVVTCSVTVAANTTYLYIFSYASYNVTATKEGTGSGTVSGTGTYGHKSTVTLTATPSPGSVFVGWQPSGSACAIPGGKGDGSVNPASTCSFTANSSTSSSFNAVARFDKSTSSPSPSPTTGGSVQNTPNTSAPAPSTASPTKPATPSIDGATIEGSPINLSEKIVVNSDKPLVLSGKTIPNGKITLFVFSEPKRYDIVADAEGKWSYTISGLPEGDHHAEIEVTDPATNLISDRAKLLDFTILASTIDSPPSNTSQDQKKSSPVLPFILIGAFVILGGASTAGFLWWKHKRKASQTFDPFNHSDPSNR